MSSSMRVSLPTPSLRPSRVPCGRARTSTDFVPDLVWHLDEPLADPSCIPSVFPFEDWRANTSRSFCLAKAPTRCSRAMGSTGTHAGSDDRVHDGLRAFAGVAPWLASSGALRRSFGTTCACAASPWHPATEASPGDSAPRDQAAG